MDDEFLQTKLNLLSHYLGEIRKEAKGNKNIEAACFECITTVNEIINKDKEPAYSCVILPKKEGEGEGRIMIDEKGHREIPAKDAEVIKFPNSDD